MGIVGSPGIFQEKMSNLMFDLEFVQTYLDDILVISKDMFKVHFAKLCQVLEKLHDASLQISPSFAQLKLSISDMFSPKMESKTNTKRLQQFMLFCHLQM